MVLMRISAKLRLILLSARRIARGPAKGFVRRQAIPRRLASTSSVATAAGAVCRPARSADRGADHRVGLQDLVISLLEQLRPDALEIHTAPGRLDDFQRTVIKSSLLRFRCGAWL